MVYGLILGAVVAACVEISMFVSMPPFLFLLLSRSSRTKERSASSVPYAVKEPPSVYRDLITCTPFS